jgi:NAD+ diphosphatase
LNDRAYYFLGDSLLLPADFPDNQINSGISFDLIKNFDKYEIFEIPAIDDSKTPIKVVSVQALPPEKIPQELGLPDSWRSIPVRQVLAIMGTENPARINLAKILRACHIVQWRKDSCFCGTCGAENIDVFKDDVHRLCPKCGRIEFPRICPAIIVIITDDKDRILLAHNKKFKEGVYSHISGFNEAGESLEDTVVREVREEINIEVKDIAYIKSQSWPFPNSLMLGFKARYLSGEIQPDGIEIEDAKWFTKDTLPGQASLPMLPAEGSLSRALINAWLADSL